MMPTAGLKVQVTAEFDEPLTVGVNCCVSEMVREVVVGLSDTVTGGARATVPLADWVGSATL
jgi:hypothetical protein